MERAMRVAAEHPGKLANRDKGCLWGNLTLTIHIVGFALLHSCPRSGTEIAQHSAQGLPWPSEPLSIGELIVNHDLRDPTRLQQAISFINTPLDITGVMKATDRHHMVKAPWCKRH